MDFKFPIKKIYGTNRRCMQEWFETYDWLHYDVVRDSVFCIICNKAYHQNKLLTKKFEKSFLSGEGFSNWNYGPRALAKHVESECHIESVSKIIDQSSTEDVGKMISSDYRQKEEQNRQCLLKIIDIVKILARQGLPFRGHGDEKNGNFNQFINLQAKYCPDLSDWLKKSANKYISKDSQNEIMKIMYFDIIRGIKEKIKSVKFISMMFDETRDISNTEQGTFCVRYVDEDFTIHESFLGLYECDKTSAEFILNVIKDILLRFEIGTKDKPFLKIRGQNYDGARSLQGVRSGVKVQVLKEEKRAIGVHCYAHRTSLAVSDTVKKCPLMRDVLNYAIEIVKLVKLSPKREKELQLIKESKQDESSGITTFSPTRSVMQCCLNSFI